MIKPHLSVTYQPPKQLHTFSRNQSLHLLARTWISGCNFLCFFFSPPISADEDHDGAQDKMQTKIKVDYNGTNRWLAPSILKSSCKINVRYFPFDEQVSVRHCIMWVALKLVSYITWSTNIVLDVYLIESYTASRWNGWSKCDKSSKPGYIQSATE